MDNGEYVLDVLYDRTFVPDLAPSRMRLVAALNGFAPPPSRDFDYLELGAGQGLTTVTLAAACPRARFVGVDLNPEHIAAANRAASSGEVHNVKFVQADFEELAESPIGTFDYVGAHGVLSWIGEQKRGALIDVVKRRLKTGGLFYASYNALPGWAAVEPLRRLIADRAATLEGDTLSRAKQALAYARQLADAGALYFANNPAARATLATMEQMGPAYVVHETMHAHWVPMYFAELARELAEADLHFVGQLPLHLNYRDLAVPAGVADVLAKVTDRASFEGLKDYALNEFFRCDVYVKGRAPRSDLVTEAYLDSTPMGAIDDGPRREVKLPHHTLSFNGAIFDVLLTLFTQRAWSVDELVKVPQLAEFEPSRVRAAVLQLTLSNQLAPMLRGPARTPKSSLRIPSAYNRAVLARPLSTEAPVVLVSEVLGNGISLPMLEAVSLRLLTEVDKSDWRRWLVELSARQPFRVESKGQSIEGDEDRVHAVLEQTERFATHRLPRMIQLGIVE